MLFTCGELLISRSREKVDSSMINRVFLNFTMKPTEAQIAFGVVAVTGVAAAGVAWFLSVRRRCSAVKVADLVSHILSWLL